MVTTLMTELRAHRCFPLPLLPATKAFKCRAWRCEIAEMQRQIPFRKKHKDCCTTVRLHPDKHPPEAQLHRLNSMDRKAWDDQDVLQMLDLKLNWETHIKSSSDFSDKI